MPSFLNPSFCSSCSFCLKLSPFSICFLKSCSTIFHVLLSPTKCTSLLLNYHSIVYIYAPPMIFVMYIFLDYCFPDFVIWINNDNAHDLYLQYATLFAKFITYNISFTHLPEISIMGSIYLSWPWGSGILGNILRSHSKGKKQFSSPCLTLKLIPFYQLVLNVPSSARL